MLFTNNTKVVRKVAQKFLKVAKMDFSRSAEWNFGADLNSSSKDAKVTHDFKIPFFSISFTVLETGNSDASSEFRELAVLV